jgi:hypothetical protein
MSVPYRGKIGQLPKGIREEVNRRMENGEPWAAVAAWLNGLPEVQAVMAAQFGGRPVAAHNVSQWRRHGYKEWLWRREAESRALDVARLPEVSGVGEGPAPLMDLLANWSAAHYLAAVRGLVQQEADGQPMDGRARLKMLRNLCRDAVALQRGQHRSARLKQTSIEALKREADQ